ncbi:uncharacterized protein [Nicotiana sylvestris]|uniref:uncharacterized protein n=1 Tax=Nicotiana sylvestris TaxID=4096 RepID=UPI00388CC19C
MKELRDSSDERSDNAADDDDERALITIGNSDEEAELIDESKDVINEKEQMSKECVVLKAKCKNLEIRASETESENVVLKNQVQVKRNNKIWCVDNGCSKHMTRKKNQFLLLEDLKGGNISFGNGKKGEIIWVGKIGMTDSHSIENLYLIDGLMYSLISVSQLCDRGNMVAFTSTKFLVISLITDKIVL